MLTGVFGVDGQKCLSRGIVMVETENDDESLFLM